MSGAKSDKFPKFNAPKLVLVDPNQEFCRDLSCGVSVYAGWSARDQVWVWAVEGEESVLEEGVGESFADVERIARKTCKRILVESIAELVRRG